MFTRVCFLVVFTVASLMADSASEYEKNRIDCSNEFYTFVNIGDSTTKRLIVKVSDTGSDVPGHWNFGIYSESFSGGSEYYRSPYSNWKIFDDNVSGKWEFRLNVGEDFGQGTVAFDIYVDRELFTTIIYTPAKPEECR